MSEHTAQNKHPDWELRIGLIIMLVPIFLFGGFYAVYKTIKEFWNAE